MTTANSIEVRPVLGLPEIAPGAQLGRLIVEAAGPAGDDVVVVSQKIVSKAEGRIVALADVRPGERAQRLAARLDKDPAIIELALRESRRIVRAERNVLITETTSGWVCANAGIDSSNVREGHVVLLPERPDDSARSIRREIDRMSGARPAVVVSDSFGRPWRLGQTDVAIGCAGLPAIDDWRGRHDRLGAELSATAIALADLAAGAADLARDKASGVPAAVIRGLGAHVTDDDGDGAAALQRPSDEDLFR